MECLHVNANLVLDFVKEIPCFPWILYLVCALWIVAVVSPVRRISHALNRVVDVCCAYIHRDIAETITSEYWPGAVALSSLDRKRILQKVITSMP